MVAARTTNELVGRVTKVHGSGFRIDGHPEWLNLSKFSDGDLPAVGAVVRARLDRSGFVRQVEAENAAEMPPPAAPPAPSAPAVAHGALDARIAALHAATAIVARQPGHHTLDEVIAAAERIEAWLTAGQVRTAVRALLAEEAMR